MEEKTQTPELPQEEPCPACEEQSRFTKFLDRLHIPHPAEPIPARKMLAALGVVLFIALVIAYYVTNGGRG